MAHYSMENCLIYEAYEQLGAREHKWPVRRVPPTHHGNRRERRPEKRAPPRQGQGATWAIACESCGSAAAAGHMSSIRMCTVNTDRECAYGLKWSARVLVQSDEKWTGWGDVDECMLVANAKLDGVHCCVPNSRTLPGPTDDSRTTHRSRRGASLTPPRSSDVNANSMESIHSPIQTTHQSRNSVS